MEYIDTENTTVAECFEAVREIVGKDKEFFLSGKLDDEHEFFRYQGVPINLVTILADALAGLLIAHVLPVKQHETVDAVCEYIHACIDVHLNNNHTEDENHD